MDKEYKKIAKDFAYAKLVLDIQEFLTLIEVDKRREYIPIQSLLALFNQNDGVVFAFIVKEQEIVRAVRCEKKFFSWYNKCFESEIHSSLEKLAQESSVYIHCYYFPSSRVPLKMEAFFYKVTQEPPYVRDFKKEYVVNPLIFSFQQVLKLEKLLTVQNIVQVLIAFLLLFYLNFLWTMQAMGVPYEFIDKEKLYFIVKKFLYPDFAAVILYFIMGMSTIFFFVLFLFGKWDKKIWFKNIWKFTKLGLLTISVVWLLSTLFLIKKENILQEYYTTGYFPHLYVTKDNSNGVILYKIDKAFVYIQKIPQKFVEIACTYKKNYSKFVKKIFQENHSFEVLPIDFIKHYRPLRCPAKS